MAKSADEQATEITIAWLQAFGSTNSVPKKDIVKEFWDTMFEAIHTAHDRLHERLNQSK